ncbi:MAG: hypothetical protein ACI9VR_001926 [Cognaticolwellia sp.]|jgi:hypothetical protein
MESEMQRALVALFLAATLSACNTAPSQTASTPTTAEPAEQVEQVEQVEHAEKHEHAEEQEHPAESTLACPMHPEITGGEGDDCTSCGMKLTPVAEPAPDAEKKEEHKGHSH